jgi:transcriptional regulator with XRE-family HTH domain
MIGHDFADALGITPSALGQYETDRATPRDVVELAKRVEGLTGIPAAWLLGLEDAVLPETGTMPVVKPAPAREDDPRRTPFDVVMF